mgnify:CR=1 FL=1
MAKNDWIVAGLNNPEFTPYDFSTIAELNLNNTQMLSADEYMKSSFIQNHDMFKDESGNFSEDKFKQYHQKRLEDFREFQEQEFPKGPQLDMFDTDRTKDSRIKDIRFDGEACAICTSSTSIMIKSLLNKNLKEAKNIIQNFENMIEINASCYI